MKSRYEVNLTGEDREVLIGIVKRGKGPAYWIKHAHILLHAMQETKNQKKTMKK
ncbi:MAG: hypothetical protein M0Q91_18595 [Methanoregula sp.]|jgi:hypothetical protein|nr:hypothetical protein [Methanoregula sp.]